jgi:hypothetical protein
MSARPVSHKGQLCQTHTTAGADIDLELEINGGPYTPWAIRFLSTGTYTLQFQTVDNTTATGSAYTDTKIAIAGELVIANVVKVLAATPSDLSFTAWY